MWVYHTVVFYEHHLLCTVNKCGAPCNRDTWEGEQTQKYRSSWLYLSTAVSFVSEYKKPAQTYTQLSQDSTHASYSVTAARRDLSEFLKALWPRVLKFHMWPLLLTSSCGCFLILCPHTDSEQLQPNVSWGCVHCSKQLGQNQSVCRSTEKVWGGEKHSTVRLWFLMAGTLKCKNVIFSRSLTTSI